MYQLMVRDDFIAQHFLTVPNCGPENEWHSHHFSIEVMLRGDTLNSEGYLADIVDVKSALQELLQEFEDTTLNDQPAFEGLNPSVEHFARILCTQLADQIETAQLNQLEVRLWEDEEAWASYQLPM